MTVHNYALTASADDAQQQGTTVVINGNGLTLSAGTHYAGFSFATAGDPIPQGTVITSATLTYYPNSTANDDPDLTWKGHKVTNSAQFTTTASELSNRYTSAPTTASVTDTATNVGTGGRALNVTAIVQELVNQAGWSNTSRLTFLAKGNGAGVNLIIYAWDSPTGQEAQLAIDFSTGPAMPVLARHYLDMMQ